jgi:hypothetical protein
MIDNGKEQFRRRARLDFSGEDCQIDPRRIKIGAQVSVGESGAWVQAWVFVPHEEDAA